MNRDKRKLNLTRYMISGLTFVRVNKLVSRNSPWKLPEELTKARTESKIEYGKMRKFKK